MPRLHDRSSRASEPPSPRNTKRPRCGPRVSPCSLRGCGPHVRGTVSGAHRRRASQAHVRPASVSTTGCSGDAQRLAGPRSPSVRSDPAFPAEETQEGRSQAVSAQPRGCRCCRRRERLCPCGLGVVSAASPRGQRWAIARAASRPLLTAGAAYDPLATGTRKKRRQALEGTSRPSADNGTVSMLAAEACSE